jgi:hypothetical protein
MTADTKTAKMMERVRALLAKADDRSVTPEEAEAFRAKADELMTRFAIDQFMIDQLAAGREVRQEIERRDFARAEGKFWWELEAMFNALARHCRCVVGHRGATRAGKPVFGLRSDLDYLDLLFTNIQLEVAKNLQPPVDPNGELGHEVFKQRQAGIAWKEITRKVYDAGLVDLTKGEREKLEANMKGWMGNGSTFEPDHRPTFAEIKRNEKALFGRGYYAEELGEVLKSVKNRLANANRRYVRDNGLDMERNYVKPEVYQRSFIYGFEAEIRDRLQAMRMATQKSYDDQHKGSEFALAVRDVYQQAVAVYEAAYPPPPPVEVDPNYKPPKGRKLAKVREVAVDYSAIRAGRAKARDTNLSNRPGDRIGRDRKHLTD